MTNGGLVSDVTAVLPNCLVEGVLPFVYYLIDCWLDH